MEAKDYVAPQIDVVDVMVERGFGDSGDFIGDGGEDGGV